MVSIRDPVADYRRAVAVHRAWEETAAATRNLGHAKVAAVCGEIAAERYRALTPAECASLAPAAAAANDVNDPTGLYYPVQQAP